jgi:hypothetical protein
VSQKRRTFESERSSAWRNMMVAAINAGLDQGLFTLEARGNCWPHADKDVHPADTTNKGAVYRFEFAGIPAAARVGDAGFDELSIHVALWPSQEAGKWLMRNDAGFEAGEAFARGWLERRNGAWLQFNGGRPLLSCCTDRLQSITSAQVEPMGYRDHGEVTM